MFEQMKLAWPLNDFMRVNLAFQEVQIFYTK